MSSQTSINLNESQNNGFNCSIQKVVYIYDETLANTTANISHIENRATMVHELIKAYNLLELMECRSSKPASVEDILTFHSNAYIDFLSNGEDDNEKTSNFNNINARLSIGQTDVADDFGLGYDCPVFTNMKEFACIIAGGTLSAVEAIIEGSKVAINWCGGWHHAQRNEASGFCYVNDIVIGIQALLKHFSRVLYIDLDAHHGDGVENAFSYSNKVMTVSFHNFETGYFPGSGNLHDVGFGRGKYYSVNVPLQSGVTDLQFFSIFEKVLSMVETKFEADVYVVQMGTDCLSGDPLGTFNLTEKCLGDCAQRILKTDASVIFLGGGGYKVTNAAKAWTFITSVIIGKELVYDIPDNKYFTEYGPDFTLDVPQGLRRNENTAISLLTIENSIQENLNHIMCPNKTIPSQEM